MSTDRTQFGGNTTTRTTGEIGTPAMSKPKAIFSQILEVPSKNVFVFGKINKKEIEAEEIRS